MEAAMKQIQTSSTFRWEKEILVKALQNNKELLETFLKQIRGETRGRRKDSFQKASSKCLGRVFQSENGEECNENHCCTLRKPGMRLECLSKQEGELSWSVSSRKRRWKSREAQQLWKKAKRAKLF